MRPAGRGHPSALWLIAIAVWAVLVPSACLLLVGLLGGQAARRSELATRAARSEAELATVSSYLGGPATATPALADLPATWAAGTALAITPRVAATSTPASTATGTATATATATVTASPSATAAGDVTIGQSVAGRPITVTQFGTGPIVRLIVAGIHGGNEPNTIALADALIATLRRSPERVPVDLTVYILRSLNPDGEARGSGIYARANDHNVDLNRNWPARWQADWSRNGCWRYLKLSGGAYGGSEPEVQALMGFMVEKQVEAVISYHSAALGIFAGGQPPDEDSRHLAEAVAAVSDYPYPALDFGCVYTGQLIDWASEQGIAAIDIELSNHRDIELEQNLRILDVFLGWRR
jgi:predicted deacylase